ncbi:hypothetical protein Sjap_020029 [Stephania japonica]|uniref:Uncharacterized protein n=1 Tax=Stephania japonica TaxID=461633 RepID=A0AAP0EZX0_9MAGN
MAASVDPSPDQTLHEDIEDDEEQQGGQEEQMSFGINSLFRSISFKEPFSHLPISPSRFTTSSVARPPLLSHSLTSSPKTYHHLPPSPLNHRCLSSMLKKDGQILTITISNGLVCTGSESNFIRVWKLPDFTECGKLKSKVGGVRALAVANDRIFAAHHDCKIRAWRRTQDVGATTHVRIATVPKFSSSVLSYIGSKHKKIVTINY